MNIWWLNHYAVIPEIGGGTRHFDIATQLVKLGHRVKIFVANYHHLIAKSWMERFKKDLVVKDGVEFIIVSARHYTGNGKKRLLNMLDYSRNVVKIGKEIVDKPDVVIGSSVHPFAWKAAYKLAKYHKAHFFIEVRDVWPDDLIKFGLMSKYNPLAIYFSLLEKWAYKKAEKIIALMPSFLKHLDNLKLGYIKEKVIIIPNGVPLERFENVSECEVIKEIFSDFERKIVFTYTGAHGPANDLKTVIDGIKILNDNLLNENIIFVFVGSGPEKENLMRMAKQLNLKNVRFINPIPKECIPYLLKISSALIFSLGNVNLEEPAFSSNKLADYMASGKPIISVDIPRLPLKETNGALFYEVGNPNSFAKAVEKFLNFDEKRLQEMGKRNIEYIKENRDIKKLAEKLIGILI